MDGFPSMSEKRSWFWLPEDTPNVKLPMFNITNEKVDASYADGNVDDAGDVETRARAVQSRHLRRTTRINLPSYNPG